jgi:endonuclease VIII-like 1
MPELAEVKIMSDFINNVSEYVVFNSLQKSDVSKVKTDLTTMNLKEFTVRAKSRGKELLLEFYDMKMQKFPQSLLVTMGMSGNWTAATGEKVGGIKHAHLVLNGLHPRRGKFQLCLVDVRRFAKWSWKDGFSANRSPDPWVEHEEFIKHFWNNIAKLPRSRDVKPMLDIIMDQSLFNGIGNYLRAEIFHRANVNPFKSFDDLEDEEIEEVLKQCKVCPQEAYVLGGGQLKDWKNSFEVEANSFLEWRKVYGVGESLIDAGGRRFWFDPKWKNSKEHKKYVSNGKKKQTSDSDPKGS